MTPTPSISAVDRSLEVVGSIFGREDLSIEELPPHMRLRIDMLSNIFPDVDYNRPLPDVRREIEQLAKYEFAVLDDPTEIPLRSVSLLLRKLIRLEHYVPFGTQIKREFKMVGHGAHNISWNVADVMGLTKELTSQQVRAINDRVQDLLLMSNDERLVFYKGRVNSFPDSQSALSTALITLEASRYLPTEIGDFYLGAITALFEAENRYSKKNPLRTNEPFTCWLHGDICRVRDIILDILPYEGTNDAAKLNEWNGGWVGQLVINCISSLRPFVGSEEFKYATDCVRIYEPGQRRLNEQLYGATNLSFSLALAVSEFRDRRAQVWNPSEWPSNTFEMIQLLPYSPDLQQAFCKIVDENSIFGLLFCAKIFSAGYQRGLYGEITYSSIDEENPQSIIPLKWYEPFLGKVRMLTLHYARDAAWSLTWVGVDSKTLKVLLDIPGMFTPREGLALLDSFFYADRSFAAEKLMNMPPLGAKHPEYGEALSYYKLKFMFDKRRRAIIQYLQSSETA